MKIYVAVTIDIDDKDLSWRTGKGEALPKKAIEEIVARDVHKQICDVGYVGSVEVSLDAFRTIR